MENDGINVLSLFDGMSCGRIALQRAGFGVDKYYSSEIDKYAITVADANWSQDKQHRLGDITKWQDWDIDWSSIDLVIGGFPCQAWSMAGKQLGDKDERGKLFWVMLDIMKTLRAHNQKADFLIENVKMKKEFEEYITFHTEQALGTVHKILINSSLVSAQNRQRYYWCNWSVPQPEDKGIMLSDILETEGVGVLKDRGSLRVKDDKSNCITASYWKGVDNHAQRTMVSTLLEHVLSEKALSRLERKKYSKPQLLPEKTGTLNTKNNSGQLSFDSGTTLIPFEGTLRKLTPIECERLQTVPDNYTNCVSNSQRYKMLGNGWTVDVIAHILRGLKEKEN